MIYKAIDIWNSPPLAHYGIPGMKWGVRNDADRAANRLARYGRKLDKAKVRYEMASQRTFRLSKKTDKLNRKADRLARRSDRVASGKSNYGIWINRDKKANSLAIKAYNTSEKKSRFEKQLYKSAAKANKYSKRVARYEKKVNKLMKQLNGVDAASLNISDKNKIYINDLLHNNLRHSDILESDYLAHYGVKGMKWGVRKSVERSGRVVRKMGGAVKNSAVRIAGGLVRTGSAIRRFKNRRAIKSGDSARIAKRVNKMSNQELADAVARAHLVSQLHNGNNSNSISLGDTVANSLKRKAGDMAANALQTTVTSAFRGESPLSAMVRSAKVEKTNQESQLSNNISQTIANNYRISNSALQNKADIANIQQNIAKNQYMESSYIQKAQELAASSKPVSSIKQTYSMPYGRRYVRRKLNTTNTYRYALYHDDMRVNEFLAHHGVKGMKWGVRHDYERMLKKNERAYRHNVENKLIYIRSANSRFSDPVVKKESLKYAKRYSKAAEKNRNEIDRIIKEVSKKGGQTVVTSKVGGGPMYNLMSTSSQVTGGILLNAVNQMYWVSGNYANKVLNKYGDTPMYMISNKYKIRNNSGPTIYRTSKNPISMLNSKTRDRYRERYYGK